MDRRSFLITIGGLLLGATRLPPMSVRRHEPVGYLIMPSYSEPHSATAWLELSNGAWQPMMFEARESGDQVAIKTYEESLLEPGLNYKEVANAPRQRGRWTVRWRQHSMQPLYLSTTVREELVNHELEYYYDPEDAPEMSHDEAVRLAVFMVQHTQQDDAFFFYEPVRLDRAVAEYENGETPKVLEVNYLPTGYHRLRS